MQANSSSGPGSRVDDSIAGAIDTLLNVLRMSSRAALQAPPGAGKTTRVPPALLHEPWLGHQRILMLEPRRIAARAAARFMAHQRGEAVGETIGYRTRLDSRVGPATRIEVLTEGILTRMLQDDPTLPGTGMVIFDEFHERSLNADLGLALALQSQSLVREDLRLLVMSATLDGAAVARLLHDAPVITSAGRSYPVTVVYRPTRTGQRTEAAAVAAVHHALREHEGDALVFLPGTAELRRVAQSLGGEVNDDVDVRPLSGSLDAAAQDAAIAPSPAGRRKVVLATSIAESSLTIDGVRVVIDSGLSRAPRFSPRTGLTRLETTSASRASTDQRCGRAGRLGPGVCYRLWPEHEQLHRVAQSPPEITAADLVPLALELAVAGVRDPADLRWLDPPRPASFAQARELLRELGALDASGLVTADGKRMATLGVHPRLARMLLRAAGAGASAVSMACDLAALLGDRDPLRTPPGTIADVDVQLRIDALHDPHAGERHGATVDRGLLHAMRAQSAQLARRLRAVARSTTERGAPRADASLDAGLLLAFAYPDRIAQRRPGPAARFLLRNGSGAVLTDGQSLAMAEFIVVAELDGRVPESRIFLAAALDETDLVRHFADQVDHEAILAFDDVSRSVRAAQRERLGAIVLRESVLARPDPDEVQRLLLDVVRREGVQTLSWSDAATRLRQRLRFAHTLDATFPDVSDEALGDSIDAWLARRSANAGSFDDLARVDLGQALLDLVPYERRHELDALAPTHIVLTSGSRHPIDYSNPAAPALAVRLQAMFGVAETPRIGRGAVPLTLHLLSPANRPVQVTRDLAGFWKGSYADVRKEMKGRYPKHDWPTEPWRTRQG
ncbi:MAG TPA: ATP-dependent helicase HrpB [Gemmatimonadaceae bacterium]|nr:ATP-dependent helicase HrpB [Gemmatimonadaceae bacterium]